MLGQGDLKSQEEPAIENLPVFTQAIPLPGCPSPPPHFISSNLPFLS